MNRLLDLHALNHKLKRAEAVCFRKSGPSTDKIPDPRPEHFRHLTHSMIRRWPSRPAS